MRLQASGLGDRYPSGTGHDGAPPRHFFRHAAARGLPAAIRRPRSGGFTLLEIMIVMLIIGIMATFAVLSVGGRSVDDRLQFESERLKTLMRLAADEALFRSEQLGLLVQKQGYRMLVLSEQGWMPYAGGAAMRAHSIPEPITIRLTVEGRPVEPYDGRLPAAGETDGNDGEAPRRGEQTSEDGQGAGPTPQILVLSSGEMTPFTLDFYVPEQDARYRVEGDLLGRVKAGRVDGEESQR